MTKLNESGAVNSSKVALAGLAATVLSTPTIGQAGEKEKKFLDDIGGDEPEARLAAWQIADQMDPGVMPFLSQLLVTNKPGVRKAASEALSHIVHGVGKELDPTSLRANRGRHGAPKEANRRQLVVKNLLDILLDGKRHRDENISALRHLSLVADVDSVEVIAGFIRDAVLREEVVFCLERIPGKTSEEALVAAFDDAVDEFKPRILAALGHRQADEAMAVCLKAMESSNIAIAMAGMKAASRIGAPAPDDVQLPDYDSLSDWQKIEYDDSLLRYADAQLKRGRIKAASNLYRRALDRTEEHLQCAAIIGFSKIGTAEAAAAIFPKLDSDDNTVRITAQKVWVEMGTSVTG